MCESMEHLFFFFNDTATTEIYTLSLHDALPRAVRGAARDLPAAPRPGPPGPAHGAELPRERLGSEGARRRVGDLDLGRRQHEGGDPPPRPRHPRPDRKSVV